MICTSNSECFVVRRPYSVPQVEVFNLSFTLRLLEDFSTAVDASVEIIEDAGEW